MRAWMIQKESMEMYFAEDGWGGAANFPLKYFIKCSPLLVGRFWKLLTRIIVLLIVMPYGLVT